MYTKLDYARLAVIQKICVTKISIFDTRPNVSQSVTFFKTTESDILYLIPPSPHHTPIFAELPLSKVWLVKVRLGKG